MQWISAFLESEMNNLEHEPDDYYGDTNPMPGGDNIYGYDDIDSEIIESLVILSLAAALAFLVYYRTQRQRRQEEARRNQQQQQQPNQGVNAVAGQQQGQRPIQPQAQQQEDRGMFPNPGDPEFLNWAAGGVGH